MSATMWVEYGYRHNDGRVTMMGLQFEVHSIAGGGGLIQKREPDVFLTELDGEPVTPVKRFVTAGEWERVNP